VQHPLLVDLQYMALHQTQSPRQAPAQARPMAREQIREILRELDVIGSAGWPDDRSPFPGLRPFDVDMHRAFFGRSREIDS